MARKFLSEEILSEENILIAQLNSAADGKPSAAQFRSIESFHKSCRKVAEKALTLGGSQNFAEEILH